MWLVVALEDRQVDLKRLGEVLGAGRLSFGSPERLGVIWRRARLGDAAVADQRQQARCASRARPRPRNPLVNVHPW